MISGVTFFSFQQIMITSLRFLFRQSIRGYPVIFSLFLVTLNFPNVGVYMTGLVACDNNTLQTHKHLPTSANFIHVQTHPSNVYTRASPD
jgi:hypothetical protein